VKPARDAKCYRCGAGMGQSADGDLRQYGPGGAWVCFECANSTPEDQAIAEDAMKARLDKGEVFVIGADGAGLIPIDKAGS
jgi:hypothetical protein